MSVDLLCGLFLGWLLHEMAHELEYRKRREKLERMYRCLEPIVIPTMTDEERDEKHFIEEMAAFDRLCDEARKTTT